MRELLWRVHVPLVAIGGLLSVCCSASFGQYPQWKLQLGDSLTDRGVQVAVDTAGDVLVMQRQDPSSLYMHKLDTDGQTLWRRRLYDLNVAAEFDVDSSGNIYYAMQTRADFRVLDSMGNQNGIFGLPILFQTTGLSVATPSVMYVTAIDRLRPPFGPLEPFDAIIRKVGIDGAFFWQKRIGGPRHDESTGLVSNPAGDVFVSGITINDLGAPLAGSLDAFVAKYDTNGTELWTRQLGTPNRDVFNDIAIDDEGNVYLVGSTEGTMAGSIRVGFRDAILTKYDSEGSLQWVRQFGTPLHDDAFGVAVDAFGQVYVSGETMGSLGGPHAGELDLFVSKFDPNGNVRWHYQTGTTESESALDIAVDPLGNVYYAGWTSGAFAGPSAGGYDVIVGKIAVPEPTTLLLAGLAVVSAGLWRRRRPASP